MATRGRLVALVVLLAAACGAIEGREFRDRHSEGLPIGAFNEQISGASSVREPAVLRGAEKTDDNVRRTADRQVYPQRKSQPLLLGAFNVQIFGASKIAKPAVLRSLGQIISRYDILLLQEIRDRKSTAVNKLLHHLNQISTERFRYVISKRLGRTNSKEQYAFFYKPSKVSVTGVFQYSDPGDVFEREPFAVRFHSTYTEVGTFAVMGIHTSPRAAEKELDALVPAYEATAKALDVRNVIITGDFNADCAYVTNREWPDVRLRTEARFEWFIKDDFDTTVGNSNCAYDRFVVVGSELQAAVVPKSVAVYRFDIALDLTLDQAKKVSDHYPIQLIIRGK